MFLVQLYISSHFIFYLLFGVWVSCIYIIYKEGRSTEGYRKGNS